MPPTLCFSVLSVSVIYVVVVADMYIVESSTYVDISLLKIEKSKGPRQLPWGIPDSTWIMSERLQLNNTLCVLLDRQLFIHNVAGGVKP